MTQDEIIEMATQAGVDMSLGEHWSFFIEELEAFAKLAAAKERERKVPHTLGPNEMELSLRREHKGKLYEIRQRFSASQTLDGPAFLIECAARQMEAKMNDAILAEGDGMTQDEIIDMARQAGFTSGEIPWHDNMFEAFYKLAAAKEREACAKVCEENATDLSEGDWDSACNNCADLIRARSNT